MAVLNPFEKQKVKLIDFIMRAVWVKAVPNESFFSVIYQEGGLDYRYPHL